MEKKRNYETISRSDWMRRGAVTLLLLRGRPLLSATGKGWPVTSGDKLSCQLELTTAR